MRRSLVYAGLMVLLIAAAAPFGAAFWYGYQTERAFTRLTGDLGREAGVTIVIKSYERGLLRSHAETEVVWPGNTLMLGVSHEITHGPLPVDDWLQGNFDFTPMQARLHSTLTEIRVAKAKMLGITKSPVSAQTLVGWNGGFNVHVSVVPAKDVYPGQALDWGAAHADLQASADLKRYELDARLPSLRLAVAGPGAAALEVLNVQWRAQMNEGALGLSFGSTHVEAGRVSAGASATVSGLKVDATTRPTGHHLELGFELRCADASVAGQRLGPSQITLEARKIDLAALAQFRDALKEIQGRQLPEQQASLLAAGKLLTLLTALAESGPEIELKRLSVKLDGGEVTGRARLILDGTRDVRTNPMRLLTAVRGEGELEVPTALLRPLIAPLIQRDLALYRTQGTLTAEEAAGLQGEALARVVDAALPLYVARHDLTRLLEPSGDHYRVRLALRQGQLLINNRPWTAQTAKLP